MVLVQEGYMNKKIITMVAAFLVVSSITVSAADTTANKNKIKENEYKLNGLEAEKDEVQAEKNLLSAELEKIFTTASKLQEDINNLTNNISEKENSISIKTLDIEAMVSKIAVLETDIADQMEKIRLQEIDLAEQEALLAQRVRSAYKFNTLGNTLLVLAESESIIDFTERLMFIEKMAEKDREVVELIESIIKELDDKKMELERSREESKKAKEELDAQKATLENERISLISEKQVVGNKLEEQKQLEDQKTLLFNQMTAKERELSGSIGDILDENAALEAEIQRAIKAEQERARLEAERKAKEEAEKNNSSSSKPSPSESNGSSSNTSSGYIRPVSGRMSSPYGYRIHPIYNTRRMHTGVDYAASSGTPIKATRGGRVILAKYNSSYGNYIIVDHGNGISSLYAHMSGFNARYGDQVRQGEVIGFIGSTGASTGPHLHFEIRVNGRHTNPSKYVN